MSCCDVEIIHRFGARRRAGFWGVYLVRRFVGGAQRKSVVIAAIEVARPDSSRLYHRGAVFLLVNRQAVLCDLKTPCS